MTRKWSTMLNGTAYDMEKFKAEMGVRKERTQVTEAVDKRLVSAYRRSLERRNTFD